MDRTCELPQRGELDSDAGEFWVANPFMMPQEGHNLSAFERNRLFLNLEGDAFLDGSFISATDIDSDSRSVVAADFNRDGRVDLLVGSVGGGPLRLFLNQMSLPSNSIRIELEGVDSNRPAIGSRIILEVGDRQIVRDVFPANGCMGQAPPEVLIGIGSAETIDRIKIRWPDGKWQELTNVSASETLHLREGDLLP